MTDVSEEVSAPITTDIGRLSPSDAQFLTEIRVAVHEAILVYEEQSVVPKNTWYAMWAGGASAPKLRPVITTSVSGSASVGEIVNTEGRLMHTKSSVGAVEYSFAVSMNTAALPRKECVVSNTTAPLCDCAAVQSLCPAHVPDTATSIVLSHSVKHGVVHVTISNPPKRSVAEAIAVTLQLTVPIVTSRLSTELKDLPITTIVSPPSTRHLPAVPVAPSQYASTIVKVGSVGADVGTAVVGTAVVGVDVGYDVVGTAVGFCV